MGRDIGIGDLQTEDGASAMVGSLKESVASTAVVKRIVEFRGIDRASGHGRIWVKVVVLTRSGCRRKSGGRVGLVSRTNRPVPTGSEISTNQLRGGRLGEEAEVVGRVRDGVSSFGERRGVEGHVALHDPAGVGCERGIGAGLVFQAIKSRLASLRIPLVAGVAARGLEDRGSESKSSPWDLERTGLTEGRRVAVDQQVGSGLVRNKCAYAGGVGHYRGHAGSRGEKSGQGWTALFVCQLCR